MEQNIQPSNLLVLSAAIQLCFRNIPPIPASPEYGLWIRVFSGTYGGLCLKFPEYKYHMDTSLFLHGQLLLYRTVIIFCPPFRKIHL